MTGRAMADDDEPDDNELPAESKLTRSKAALARKAASSPARISRPEDQRLPPGSI